MTSRRRAIPGVLWIALVSGGLMVVGKVIVAATVSPLIMIDAWITAALVGGLYAGRRWAYVATIVVVILGGILGLSRGVAAGMMTLLLDALVLVPVLMSRDYFFSSTEERSEHGVQTKPDVQ